MMPRRSQVRWAVSTRQTTERWVSSVCAKGGGQGQHRLSSALPSTAAASPAGALACYGPKADDDLMISATAPQLNEPPSAVIPPENIRFHEKGEYCRCEIFGKLVASSSSYIRLILWRITS